MTLLKKPKLAAPKPLAANPAHNESALARRFSHNTISRSTTSSLSSIPTQPSAPIPSLKSGITQSQSQDSFQPISKSRSERNRRNTPRVPISPNFVQPVENTILIPEDADGPSSSILDPEYQDTFQYDENANYGIPAISLFPLQLASNTSLESYAFPKMQPMQPLGPLDAPTIHPLKRAKNNFSNNIGPPDAPPSKRRPVNQPLGTPRIAQIASTPSFSMAQFSKRLSQAHPQIGRGFLPNNDTPAVTPRVNAPCLSSRTIKTRSLPSNNQAANILKFTNSIIIKVKSNWGHPSSLLFSAISVLDENKRSIKIQMISSVPNIPGVNLLEKIADNHLVKKEDDIFTIPFQPNSPNFTLILSLRDEDKPKFVRIWNPTIRNHELENAVTKDVSIIYEDREAATGQIPKNFGTDIELLPPNEENDSRISESSLLLASLFPDALTNKFADFYGEYPLPKYTEITIEVLQSYQKVTGLSNIGLNGIDFYDGEGVKLKPEQFKIISVKNIIKSTSFYSSPKYIIRDSMFHNLVQYQFYAGCHYTNRSTYQPANIANSDTDNTTDIETNMNPVFVFQFHKPTSLTKISIWNYNAASEDLKDGIKNIIIRADGKIIYSGKVKIGKGFVVGLRKSTTMIWLTDAPNLKKIIQASELEEDHIAYLENQ